MKFDKTSFVLLICMIVFGLVKNFAPPKFELLFVVLLPVFIIIIGIFVYKDSK